MGWAKKCYTAKTNGTSFRNSDDQAAFKQELRRLIEERRDASLGPLRAEVASQTQRTLDLGVDIPVVKRAAKKSPK